MKLRLHPIALPAFSLCGIAAAGLLYALHIQKAVQPVLLITLIAGSLPLIFKTVRELLSGKFGVDVIALTAIVTSFLLSQYLAGSVIVLMLSGGEALEDYAARRAKKELTALLRHAPQIAHIQENGALRDVPAGHVHAGDVIVIKPGETAPVDGIVLSGKSEMDESALTGESLPEEKEEGSRVLSGSVNGDGVLDVKALRPAAESKYEQIVRLVTQAQQNRAPVVRLADRYSAWFTVITFAMACTAWIVSKDPIRVLAVLVVATPCPLILATPIALISGISRAAGRGIIVKTGAALEKLASVPAMIFDKTGTLTLGAPAVTGIIPLSHMTAEDVLVLAASLDQLSAHVLARSLVQYARKHHEQKHLIMPEQFFETFGQGVRGVLENNTYYFGKINFLSEQGIDIPDSVRQNHEQLRTQGKMEVFLGGGGRLLGSVIFTDVVRPEMANFFSRLTKAGLRHIVMVTGDKKDVAQTIGRQLGISDIHAEALPEDKVREVEEHRRQFGGVAMVGDGINDAPALAVADVGIAMSGHGGTAAAETGDIVITIDNIERVAEAAELSKYVIAIAKQGIFFGMGASILLMVVASLGLIRPVYGALLQELIDVTVILNALRINFKKLNS